jgi:hypothetical protein
MPHKIKVGDAYQTLGGKQVRIICTDRRMPDYPVLALVQENGVELLAMYTADGKSSPTCSFDFPDNLVLPESYDDWEIDDPIWVWDDGDPTPQPRHFAGVVPNGDVLAWHAGLTSHTKGDTEPCPWPYASKTRPATAE